MKYNFDEIVDRRGTSSLKWDVSEGELPMWVADMDFKTAPEIIKAVENRASHGVYGYNIIPQEWNEAISSWWERRHGYKIEPKSLIFCTGIVPAISSVVRKMTTPNENVLIMTPVYNIFFNSIINSGRRALECQLVYDGEKYEIDFCDLERKLSDPQTSMMVLCNPHNPIGKIWDKQTLERIGELCNKYHVFVLSDEIHCDLCDPHKKYVPFASASETCKKISATAISASKAFNIAGLQAAAVYADDENIRHKIWRTLNTDEVAEPNTFAICATIAAFNEGEEWLEELRKYLFDNKECVRQFVKKSIPNIKVVPSEATYLLWLDCSAITSDSVQLSEKIRAKTGLYLSDGAEYGGDGKFFLRINTACPRAVLKEGLERLKRAIELIEKEKV